jgi:hypothetical protein
VADLPFVTLKYFCLLLCIVHTHNFVWPSQAIQIHNAQFFPPSCNLPELVSTKIDAKSNENIKQLSIQGSISVIELN